MTLVAASQVDTSADAGKTDDFHMEFGQKFGAALLMIIPGFVGGGLWYQVFHHSWAVGIIWFLLMPAVWYALVTGKIHGIFKK